jgi:two-component system, cell cycle sensor histidine kinase and response regulator CckA
MATAQAQAPAFQSVSTVSMIRGMLEAQSNVVLLLDSAGILVGANAAAAKALGVEEPDAIIGRNVFELLPPAVAAVRREYFDRALATGRAQHFDDGREDRRLRSHVCPIRGQDGRTALVVVVSSDVTEWVRAEEALRVSLGKYKVLFESFPLGVVITDASGAIVEANPKAEVLTAMRRDEHTGRLIQSPDWALIGADGGVVNPDEYAGVVALREGRAVYGQELGIARPDGSTVWLDVSAAPIPVPGFGVAVTFSDSSARREAERALRATEQKHQALFDNTAEGIALHQLVRDAEGQPVDYVLTDINPQYEAILGLRGEQVIGRRASEVYGVTPAPYLAEFSSAPLTGKPVRFETYFAPMGKHFSISVAPLGPDGFATIFFDITAGKRSQEEHERLSALVECSSEFIGLATLDGRVFYLNEAGRRASGFGKDDSLDGWSIFDFIPPGDRAWFAEQVLPAVRSEGSWSGQGPLMNPKTGETLRVDSVMFAIPSGETGEPLCLAAVMHDITERERAREERERLEERLQQAEKMESIGRLAGGVAHDFNNLLTVILGNLESVLAALNPADPIYQPLTEVQRAGESAASLTRQLLAFSRKQIIAPTAVDLNALIGAMERMLRRIIGEDVELDVRTAPGLSRVRADAGQLEQIIVNLSVNARDAMPGGGRLVIETSDVLVGDAICLSNPAARPGPFVRLAVIDTGAGMTEEEKSKAFEPFFTTKTKGTGLGLAMVYGAVSQHNGFVGLTSDVGRGTTIEVFLPATSDVEGEGALSDVPASATGAETIFLVEDDELVRGLTERALSRLGYRVFAFSDGAAALAAAEAFSGAIHLLLTDVVMPGMNGRELALRLAEVRPEARTLFASGHTADVMLRHGLLESGVHFISKPYTPQILAARVRAVLDAGQ